MRQFRFYGNWKIYLDYFVHFSSVLTFSASATTGGSINDPQKASSTNTGDSSSPSSAAASHWHFTPVGTLAMTGVAVLFVVLVL